MNEPIGDEAIYLRIAQFEEGLIQLTDTTNAYRLFAKYGRTSVTTPLEKMTGLEQRFLGTGRRMRSLTSVCRLSV
jgi:hypothetical protein